MQKTILLVDDEPHVLRILRLALEKENYRVMTAYNGELALEIMEEYIPDILISDIQEPHGVRATTNMRIIVTIAPPI